jgi:hypothetical protein
MRSLAIAVTLERQEIAPIANSNGADTVTSHGVQLRAELS